ncbi:alpha-(1,3)-fucosyltransferase C [Fopius arisanus]|uniref:Fucosyltransferase n=1 Tax=Fopius arisanus TaxID=64838 RepID=A0A0C9QWC0_9HYME|nr:PREDICTED: alpha-(1,3)-fucosyltransferase C-like [Fopius arisanus]
MLLCGRGKRLWLLAFIVTLACLHLVLMYCDIRIVEWEPSKYLFGFGKNDPPHLGNSTKKILYWNTMFGDETFYFGHGDIFNKCPDLPTGGCYATHDRYIFDIRDYDALLFHGNELSVRDRPAIRDQSQFYVFVNLESPVTWVKRAKPFFEDYFNLTMTYRVDSDVQWSYYSVRDRISGDIVAPVGSAVWKTSEDATADLGPSGEIMEIIKTKRKTAVWFVSNCETDSAREKYVKELSKHVDVDIYGRCGSEMKCPKGEDCFRKIVEPEYFFYLSFENSLCQDYVTEKLSNALMHNVVPVVYGGADYGSSAPPNSYINTLDFRSPKELAQFLIRLTKNPSKYAEYFRWKRYYEIVPGTQLAICRLCKYLHGAKGSKVYNSMADWYLKGKCPLQDKLKSFPYATQLATMFADD